MKDLTKVFIDLSKLSGEQQDHIISLLPDPELDEDYAISSKYCYLRFDIYKWFVGSIEGIESLSELTYPEFIKLFEGGDGEILPAVAYWRNRCLLAEKCLSVSPCDPDITDEQINAHKSYNQFLETFGNKD